jgi:hypothetical protein
MKKTHLRKTFRATIYGGILGVVVSTAMILITDWTNDSWGLGVFLAIPSMWLGAALGTQNPFVCNAYVINGILFAVGFVLIAAIWSFLMKDADQD